MLLFQFLAPESAMKREYLDTFIDSPDNSARSVELSLKRNFICYLVQNSKCGEIFLFLFENVNNFAGSVFYKQISVRIHCTSRLLKVC